VPKSVARQLALLQYSGFESRQPAKKIYKKKFAKSWRIHIAGGKIKSMHKHEPPFYNTF
jgi:hypothetical protein